MGKYIVFYGCFLLSSLYSVHTLPIREKISINTDLLNKVRQGSNYTGGGPGRVNNFAWRISVTMTTPQDPEFTTKLSIDELEKHPEQNEIIHNALTHTLRDPNYRRIWQSLVKEDFKNLIREMRLPGARQVFIKDNYDGAFDGSTGEALYTKLVNFLEAIGIKGYNIVLDSATNTMMVTFSGEYTTRRTTTTTTEPTTTTRNTTIGVKEIEENKDYFLKVYVQMSITLKHKKYRDMWNNIVDKQGFPTLLQQMRKNGAHRIFMKDNGDKAWDGPEGAKLYETIVKFLRTIGLRGYKTFLESVSEIPLTVHEEAGITPADSTDK